jgi:hypothetical protein
VEGRGKPLKRLVSILRQITGLKAGVNERCNHQIAPQPPFRLRVTRTQPLQGEAGHFARIFQIKFVFYVRPVGLHSFGAEM